MTTRMMFKSAFTSELLIETANSMVTMVEVALQEREIQERQALEELRVQRYIERQRVRLKELEEDLQDRHDFRAGAGATKGLRAAIQMWPSLRAMLRLTARGSAGCGCDGDEEGDEHEQNDGSGYASAGGSVESDQAD